MPGAGRPLPTFPCMCKAIYSWGGETKRDLGFIEGDLIECLNAGDGQWWMGRLRRNKTVGLFPSNYVEVLENYQRPGILSRPASRAASPSMLGQEGGRKSRVASPAPSTRSRVASPQPPTHRPRAHSPQPPHHQGYYGNEGGGGSSRSRTGRSPSPAPYHHESISRTASPNPYNRAVSPIPYYRGASPAPFDIPKTISPAPAHFRAVSPAPSMRHYQRAASPNIYMGDEYDDTDAPPAPPPHRVNRRAASPLPPQHDDRLTPSGSRAPTPNGQTPSPLRSAMEDVMESLQHMTSHDDRPNTPQAPWSPDSFGEVYNLSPKKRYVRPETSLGIAGRNEYEDEEDENGMPMYLVDQRPADRMEDRLRRFQNPLERRISDEDISPPLPAKISSYGDRSRSMDPTLRTRKSAHDLRASAGSAIPLKMNRPRPLSRVETLSSNSTSNHSSSTNNTQSTAFTSASIMSGVSAGAISATSAGSLARRKHKSISVIEGVRNPHRLKAGGSFGSRPETPSGYYSSGSGSGSGAGTLGRKRGQTWATPSSSSVGAPGVFGGLAAPKPKKSSFFKKILNSAKTSAASVRSVTESPAQVSPQFSPKTIPDGITAIAGGRAAMQAHGQDWVQVRRDVNRSNTLSRNERIERQEKQQMMDQPVLRPVDALDEDVDGDEAADGSIVENPQDFDTANLALVDKASRFISSLPPFTTPESLASHHVCRPYRSDVQRLRAIFTWVSEKIAWEHPSGPMDGEYGQADVDTRRVLSQKRGSPEEAAFVVQGMCNAVGIHCDVIHGFLKAPGETVDIDSCPRPNHWWNAVIVDGEWRLMDCSLASPTHPRRFMYSYAPANQAEFFYFLTKPSEFCWTHVPLSMDQQHMVPPLPLPLLLTLPCACPPFFRHGLQMMNFDTSSIRMEDLEVVQIEFSVPQDVECVAEVEANGFAMDQDGDVFETGEVIKKRALAQVIWENGVKIYRVKAVLPGDEGQGVLKIYAGKRGLMHSIGSNPHPLAFALPIHHSGENPPYDFFIRHPTPHAQRHDLYVSQPQCAKLAVNNTFVFVVRQSPSDGTAMPVASNGNTGAKPAKLGIQTPSGKILRLMKKADTVGSTDGMVWETIIKCGEKGPWRALVLADRSARWCVYGEWQVV